MDLPNSFVPILPPTNLIFNPSRIYRWKPSPLLAGSALPGRSSERLLHLPEARAGAHGAARSLEHPPPPLPPQRATGRTGGAPLRAPLSLPNGEQNPLEALTGCNSFFFCQQVEV